MLKPKARDKKMYKDLGQAVHIGPCAALLTQPRGLVSQHGCVSGTRAVPCTAAPSNLNRTVDKDLFVRACGTEVAGSSP
ncbi:hypothetical protein IEO21_08115 [Rhodonia placenta]|uniref:Uncharacterized protein n=2 Tax=Rhodonia placenta TaxID=104341 RepID=A0A8H7NX25_9APHY|nr:hypothetical protein IEO21_08115 [Postia placenta]